MAFLWEDSTPVDHSVDDDFDDILNSFTKQNRLSELKNRDKLSKKKPASEFGAVLKELGVAEDDAEDDGTEETGEARPKKRSKEAQDASTLEASEKVANSSGRVTISGVDEDDTAGSLLRMKQHKEAVSQAHQSKEGITAEMLLDEENLANDSLLRYFQNASIRGRATAIAVRDPHRWVSVLHIDEDILRDYQEAIEYRPKSDVVPPWSFAAVSKVVEDAKVAMQDDTNQRHKVKAIALAKTLVSQANMEAVLRLPVECRVDGEVMYGGAHVCERHSPCDRQIFCECGKGAVCRCTSIFTMRDGAIRTSSFSGQVAQDDTVRYSFFDKILDLPDDFRALKHAKKEQVPKKRVSEEKLKKKKSSEEDPGQAARREKGNEGKARKRGWGRGRDGGEGTWED
eukprot:Rmarinus@m.4690